MRATSTTAASLLTGLRVRVTHLMTTMRATANTAVFLFKVFPMLPSRPLNWATLRPVVERLRYKTSHGDTEGDFYRPSGAGPHAGVVVYLGVVPFGVDHPQVLRLGEALARSGFGALLYWSPAMQPSGGGKSWCNLAANGKALVEPRGQFTQQRFGFIE
jgi:hypothetical protein